MRTQTRLDAATRRIIILSQNIRPVQGRALDIEALSVQRFTGQRAFSKLNAVLARRASFKQA